MGLARAGAIPHGDESTDRLEGGEGGSKDQQEHHLHAFVTDFDNHYNYFRNGYSLPAL